jgi:hypothetical protein
MKILSELPKEGWGILSNQRKFHYFKAGRSLCGKWAAIFMPDLELGKNDHPDNCQACRKKVIKLQEIDK